MEAEAVCFDLPERVAVAQRLKSTPALMCLRARIEAEERSEQSKRHLTEAEQKELVKPILAMVKAGTIGEITAHTEIEKPSLMRCEP